MTITEYLIAFSMGAGVVAIFALPILISLVIALATRPKLEKKLLFIFITSSLSYGIAVIFGVFLTPFNLIDTYFIPQWSAAGYENFTTPLGYVIEILNWVPLVILAIASIVIPWYGRREIWPKLIGILANKANQL